jgi:hypothetical protein
MIRVSVSAVRFLIFLFLSGSIYTEERNHFPFFGCAAAGREAAITLYGGVCIHVILENGIPFRFPVYIRSYTRIAARPRQNIPISYI